MTNHFIEIKLLDCAWRLRYAMPMKIQKYILAVISLLVGAEAFAHCPSSYKEEKVCFMLEKNHLYIYDHKVEHNGPYKDFEKADLLAIKTLKNESLPFKKLARGIYKIDSAENVKTIKLEVSSNKKKEEIKVNHE